MGAWSQDEPVTIAEALKQVQRIIEQNPIVKSRGWGQSESEWIIQTVLKKKMGREFGRTQLYSALNDRFATEWLGELRRIATGRAAGAPLQHLLGVQNFLNFEYVVNPMVLVPRPETEVLVQSVLEWATPRREFKGIEVGLGSGAIACELLAAKPGLQIWASEASLAAREVATRNASTRLGDRWNERLHLVSPKTGLEIFEPFAADLKVDFLVSNPPYLSAEDFTEGRIDAEVWKSEPREALVPANGNWIYFYRVFAERARDWLLPGGALFLEIPSHRMSELYAEFMTRGWKVTFISDLGGAPRVLKAE